MQIDLRMSRRGKSGAHCAMLGIAVVLALGIGKLSQGQSGINSGANGAQNSTGQGFGGRQGFPLANNNNNNDQDLDPVMAERRFRALNMERQKRMVADANKLLTLAKELNDQVAAEKSGSLSVDQIHKIGEIEKLARSVKDRMTAGVVDVPSIPPPMTPNFPTRQLLSPQ